MAWYDEDSWATAAFAPKGSTIAITFLIAVLLPILLHQFIYRNATPTAQPSFLLLGPSGGGKTAFLTLVRFSCTCRARGPLRLPLLPGKPPPTCHPLLPSRSP
jgi:hypothetical protein